MSAEITKRCGRCGLHYVRARAFVRHVRTADGFQPYCMRCDSMHKAELPKGYRRLLKALERDENTLCLPEWPTVDVYLAVFEPGVGHEGNRYGRGECYWCGGAVNGWSLGGGNSSGYWIDRRSNKLVQGHKAYVPSNCIPACTPCNFEKGAKNSHVFAPTASLRLTQFGWGRVQWDEVSDRYHRAMPPDLSEWVRGPQPDLPGLTAAARGPRSGRTSPPRSSAGTPPETPTTEGNRSA